MPLRTKIMKIESQSVAKKNSSPESQNERRVPWFDGPMRALLNNEAFRCTGTLTTKRRFVSR